MHDQHGAAVSRAPTLQLASAGFVATAVAFGPARMGFGLFLPVFREDFALSTSQAGFVAGGGFFAFLLALPAAAWLDRRVGQRFPVIAGALLAAGGFTAAALAQGAGTLAAGIAIAGASAGLCWSPFNDAAQRVVPRPYRPGALSAVSTGTSVGVMGAAALALGVTFDALSWRTAWAMFAGVAIAAALGAFFALPGGRQARESRRRPRLLGRAALPLYLAALLFGATNAVYLSFAADRVVMAGGVPGLPERASSAVIFLSYGLFGLLGLATGRIEARSGLDALLAAIFAAFALSLALVALMPGSWAGVIASSGLHGAAVMTISAAFSFWSLRLFPENGTTGFTAALVAGAVGSVLGPVLAGRLVEALGPGPAFLLFTGPSLLAALAFGLRARRGGSDAGRERAALEAAR